MLVKCTWKASPVGAEWQSSVHTGIILVYTAKWPVYAGIILVYTAERPVHAGIRYCFVLVLTKYMVQ